MKNKCLVFEDYASLPEEIRLKLREFQTNKKLGVAKHDPQFGYSTLTEVEAHFSSLMASTTDAIKVDNLNRCFIQTLDEGEEQTKRILQHQAMLSAGLVSFKAFESFQAQLHDAIRLLENLEVVNPYAIHITSLPTEINDPRRLFELILGLINVVTLLNQKNRKKDSLGRLIVIKEDVQLALDLTLDMFIIKSDDLGRLERKFMEDLKKILVTKATKDESLVDVEFKIKDLYEPLKDSYGTSIIHIRIKSLATLGFVQQVGGNKKLGEKYILAFDDKFDLRKKRIKSHFINLLETA